MPNRPIATLAACLFIAAFAALPQPADKPPDSPPPAFAGTFANDRLSISLAPTPTGLGGTILLAGEKSYPFTATARDATLAGQFSDGAASFTFTAKLDDPDTLVLTTGSTTYRLARQNAQPQPANEPLPPPDPRAVDAAIARAKAYLYAAQTDANWDLLQRQPEPQKQMRKLDDVQNSTQWGGLSALATYTLLAAGDNPQSPKLAAAIEFLKKAQVNGTYALACRLLVWNAMPAGARKGLMPLVKRDRDLLLKNKRSAGPARGLFRYLPEGQDADFSASQFGVLGLWAADQLGAEVPTSFWTEARAAWLAGQRPDGGWPYMNFYRRARQSTPSMTAAGVATLFITADALAAASGADCRGNLPHRGVDAGIAWITNHADDYFLGHNDFPFYTLYGVERIGLASGLKHLGTVDWYRRGAAALLDAQNDDGSWGAGVADTCFATLFLVRGRAPVVLSKLQYAFDLHGDRPRPANWNQRPRDAANLSRWIGRELEREVQWQIVNLAAPVEDLHDAPILYIAGNQQLLLGDADEKKLQQFVHQGGLILGNADCAAPAFAASFKKLGTKLFPPYEFRELPAGHLVYENLYTRSKWKNPPAVQGLSNGARELMILLPTADPARYWQTGAAAGHEPAFQLLANLFLYTSEHRDLRFKGQSWLVARDAHRPAATRTLKLARLRHDYNWDPEPGGWPRLAAILHNEHGIDLSVQTVTLGQGKLSPADYKLAHLTATGRLKLKDDQKAELKKFLEAGGTLLADAAGGEPEAAAALEAELESATGAKLQVLPPDHPVYAHLGLPPDQITYRPYAIKRSIGNLTGPRLRGATLAGRTALLVSPEDLSVGLVGQPIDGIFGYTPTSATAIVKSIVLTAAGEN